MATQQTTSAFNASSDAYIREFAVPIHNILYNGGWVQTSDTGQTNASALTAATTAQEKRGYEIWRMNDSMQATAPIFMRIDYGSAHQIACGQLWITIGTGSDGAGNITGVIQTAFTVSINSSEGGGSTQYRYILSAAANRFAIFRGEGRYGVGCSVERALDASGGPSNAGVYCLSFNTNYNSSALNVMTCRVASSLYNYANSTSLGAFVPTGTTWAGESSKVGVCPVRFFNGQPSNPCLNWVAYLHADIAQDSYPQVNLYGTVHNYYAIGTGRLTMVASANTNATLAMIWE